MAVHLLTGHAGTPHVTSDDQRHQNAVLLGAGAFIVSGCACTIKNANTLHIAEGMIYANGAFVRVTAGGQDVAIQSGVVGETRTDYVVLRYTVNGSGIESAEIICKKNARATAGNILEGVTTAEFDLYSVTLTGVSVGTPVQVMPSFSAIAALGLGNLAAKNSLTAGDIPSIDAGKVTSGTFSADRIPTIGDAKISGIAASKVTGLGTGATISPNDYIVAHSYTKSQSAWSYIKWNSGACLMWGNFKESSTRNMTAGNAFQLGARNLPFKVYRATTAITSKNYAWQPYTFYHSTEETTQVACAVYPLVSQSGVTLEYDFVVFGSWK